MMKGKLKQLISILLISVLVLSMAAPGFAATGTHTLKINSQTAGHTFQVYQVFQGNVDINSEKYTVLTDITWGTGIDSSGLVQALKETENSYLVDIFDGVIDYDKDPDDLAADIAGAISDANVATNSNAAYAFADLVSEHLGDEYENATCTENSYDKDTKGYFYYYEITGLADGYYFLRDTESNFSSEDTQSYTRYILGIVGGDLEINAKADKPNIDKHVDVTEKTQEYNIGDDIPYQLKSKVPDMEGYNSYWFMAHDSLSEGLDFKQVDSITVGTEGTEGTNKFEKLEKARQINNVYVGGVLDKDLSSESGSENAEVAYTYTVYNYEYRDSNNEKTGTELYIVLNKFYESYSAEEWTQQPIVIDYTVRFNKNASIGTKGNDNVVELVYSNNPNSTYKGEPTPETGPKDGVGKTTKKTTVTYTTGIKIWKNDGNDTSLAGASFKLSEYGDNVKTFYTWEATATYRYIEDSSGLYVDKNEMIAGADAEYVEYDESTYPGHTRYRRTTDSNNSTYTVTTEIDDKSDSLIGTTGTDGYVIFKGLGAGIYELTEVSSPDGYSKLTSPLYVRIVYEDPEGYDKPNELTLANQPAVGTDLAKWSFYWSEDVDATFSENWKKMDTDEVDGGLVGYLGVVNPPGALLPATGGVGTVIFTAVGLCAMAGAVIFLYTKRRREEQ